MNIELSPSELEFRDNVRSFLATSLPEELRNAAIVNISALFEYDISHAWHEILYAHGLAAPSWPEEYGGKGWTAIQEYIWRIETWRASAPVISQLGMRLVAPILLQFGTEDQKREFLPRLLSGEHYWCQGFSEPGAGSDLASLKCAAVLEEDCYVVNGTKLWQTHAHYSNWMILLVRTKDTGKPQDGITCLIVSMESAGIAVQPIKTIAGDHEVNQVFLDDVRVPVSQRIGQDGDGWMIAKHLLAVERASPGNATARLRAQLTILVENIHKNKAARDDPFIIQRLANHSIDTDVVEMLELETLQNDPHQDDGGVVASTIKLRASIVEQAIHETAVMVLGDEALEWESKRPLHAAGRSLDELKDLAVIPRYLNSRVRTIFGGSTEVQLGIIAKWLSHHQGQARL